MVNLLQELVTCFISKEVDNVLADMLRVNARKTAEMMQKCLWSDVERAI